MFKVLATALHVPMHKLAHLRAVEETSVPKPKCPNNINIKEGLRSHEVSMSASKILDTIPLLSKLLRLEATFVHLLFRVGRVSYLKEERFICFIISIIRYSKGSLVELLGPLDFRSILTMVAPPARMNQEELLSDVLEEQNKELIVYLMHKVHSCCSMFGCYPDCFKHILNLKLQIVINQRLKFELISPDS